MLVFAHGRRLARLVQARSHEESFKFKLSSHLHSFFIVVLQLFFAFASRPEFIQSV